MRFGVSSAAAVAALLVCAPCLRGRPALPSAPAAFRADDWVAVRDLARIYGAPVRRDAGGRYAIVGPRHSLWFADDGRRIRLQGVEVWLSAPLSSSALSAGGIHRADAAGLVDVVFRPWAHLGRYSAETIVLDPGHGGRDGGAVGENGLLEKDLTLALARAVRARLAVAGCKVYLTRNDDSFVELDERPRIAAAKGGDLMVSLHFNAAGVGARGAETFVLARAGAAPTRAPDPRPSERYRPVPANAHDAANFALGYHLQRQLVRAAGYEDRGVRHARFAVLRAAPCPAALVECGFLTDPEDARRIADPHFRERLAEALARGILDYAMTVRRARAARGAPP